MIIPKALIDATRSRFWRTASTPPLHMQPAAAVDERAELAHELPASPAPAPYVPEVVVRVSVTPAVTPGDLLLIALDACSDDVQRAALLAAASVQAREQMSAALVYREMSTLAGRNPPLSALVAALDGAADESGRAALLSATSPALLAELAEHLRPADVEGYMAMVIAAPS